MKKIIAMLALVAAGSAFAGSASVEYQSWDNPTTGADTTGLVVSVRENLTQSIVGDVALSTNQADAGTRAVGSRAEAGLTYSVPVGVITGYIRGASGVKSSTGASTSFYSVEPGVSMKVTNSLTAKVGYRFRDAYDSTVADQTRTVRAGLSYALSKQDSVGIRYDRQRGDSLQNIWAINYTRGF